MTNRRKSSSPHSELENKLKKAFESCEIQNGVPEIKRGDPIWEFLEAVVKCHEKYLDVFQALRILFDIIGKEFCDYKNHNKSNGKLQNLLDKTKFINLQNEILVFIKSLPRDYSIYFHLSPKNKHGLKNFNFGVGLDFLEVVKDNDLSKMVIDAEDNRALRTDKLGNIVPFDKKISAFQVGDILLRIKTKGHAKNNITDSAITEALSKIKCLFYLGNTMDIFTTDDENQLVTLDKKTCDLFLADDTSGDQRLERIKLSSDMTDQFTRYNFKSPTFARGLPTLPQNVPNREALLRIGGLLSADEEDENRKPIVTATEWAFDSLVSHNKTVSFLQLCIGLESILGDEDLRGRITGTLSDRCAYLLGTTPNDRAKIKKDFTTLYDHRSQLIHGRRLRLDRKSEESLSHGKFFLDLILKKEMKSFKPAGKNQGEKGERGKISY